jgi:hypothetical protein
MSAVSESLVVDILDLLERRESELLSWGIVDGGFTEDELYDLVDEYLLQEGALCTADEVIDELLDRRVLFRLRSGRDEVYRTRMAEAVRLFSRLRLITPWRAWRDAPTLVSDFRFNVRPRVYPQRNWPLDEDAASGDASEAASTVLGAIEDDVRLTDLQRRVFRDLVHPVQNDETRKQLQLSEFQVQAARRVLSDVRARESRGMIVCAGTGTGKTMAFYNPAFAQVATDVRAGDHWTKVLALYPRKELLKDQLSDAYENARRLDDAMVEDGQRKITIGAYYGDTPTRASNLIDYDNLWPEAEDGDGFLCPFLRCPACDAALQWNRADVEAGTERLECTAHDCNHVVEEDEVCLTRRRMMDEPPDLLFTTTEMMNRLMGNHHHSRVIGVGTTKPAPKMVLLDEVHTYSGTHGAQVAHLLRRWWHAVKQRGRPQFTGLSATLRSARDFFATLTGLNAANIEKVEPSDENLTESKSAEYQLALRGDPVSGTSLLSTSIQALMLLRRVLDPQNGDISDGLYGQRAFAFTDNLDVINRFYHNFLDAEGRHPGGWQEGQSYARFRSPLHADDPQEEATRFEWGQSWRVVEEIGHPDGLQHPLRIDRTSSQDAGVRQDSDVVIATASLEVGYNDSSVGGVLQHKAPMSMASFLQRKGRAGRPPEMRPWTVVVLSDYGRDRMAYQGYDQLFSPIIEERHLPVSNRYILRMQAVFAAMDWLAEKGRDVSLPGGSMWEDFGEPAADEYHDEREQQREKRQAWIADQIRAVLDGKPAYHDLRNHIRSALDLSDAETHAVFWDPPRALMTAALPTILRRLDSGWDTHAADDLEHEPFTGNPLPEFAPQALFKDLNLPEVDVVVPQQGDDEPESHAMPVAQAMREYAPGRVSRRFGVRSDADTHWIRPPSLDAGDREQQLSISEFCDGYSIGTVDVEQADGAVAEVPCIRPVQLKTEQVPDAVWDSANAFLDWRSQIAPFSTGNVEDVSTAINWHELIPDIAFYRHDTHNPVEVRRFAVASEAEVGFHDERDALNARIEFAGGDGAPVAIGFTQEVDGIAFRVNVPDDLETDPDAMRPEKRHALRTAYYEHRLQTTEALEGVANRFQRDWLYQLSLAAVSSRAAREQMSLQDASEQIRRQGTGEAMVSVLDRIFQSLPAEAEEAEGEDRTERIREELEGLCHQPLVEQVVNDELAVLWGYPGTDWENWMHSRFLASLGRALLEACNLSCPEFDGSELLLDLDAGPRPAGAVDTPEGREEIWITEETMGGTGVVEEIARRYRQDPRHFFQLVESALSESDFELVDTELQRVLNLAETDAEVQNALADVRGARGMEDVREANADLRSALTERGVLGIHAVYAGLQNRILRPGSSESTDRLLRRLVRDWQAEEERLGVELDARVFAYTASQRDEYRTLLQSVEQGRVRDDDWRFQTIYGLLWPRGRAVRERALDTYNPFADLPAGDRLLVVGEIPDREQPVDVTASSWAGIVRDRLRDRGVARVSSPSPERSELQEAIMTLVTDTVETGFLQVHPRLNGIERTRDGFVATLTLPEVAQ